MKSWKPEINAPNILWEYSRKYHRMRISAERHQKTSKHRTFSPFQYDTA